MAEQIYKQHQRHKQTETETVVDIPGNGAGEKIPELQTTIERLLGKVSYDLAANSVEPIS